MTAPMMPPQQPMQPPQPPPSPFPVRANDAEPVAAAIYAKRLSKLQVEPKFMAMQEKFPEWAQMAIEAYQRAVQAVQAAQPPQPLPRGVSITDAVNGGDIGAAEQSALHPKPAQPAQPPQMPKPAGAAQ